MALRVCPHTRQGCGIFKLPQQLVLGCRPPQKHAFLCSDTRTCWQMLWRAKDSPVAQDRPPKRVADASSYMRSTSKLGPRPSKQIPEGPVQRTENGCYTKLLEDRALVVYGSGIFFLAIIYAVLLNPSLLQPVHEQKTHETHFG